MERINNNYIKINKMELFYEIIRTSERKDDEMKDKFQKILDAVLDAEIRREMPGLEELFIPKEYFTEEEILNIPIRRKSMLNAHTRACINDDMDEAVAISKLVSKEEVLPNELGSLGDYILEHSMDMDEYFDGEKRRYIYDSLNDKIEMGCIFHGKKPKVKRLTLDQK